MLINKVLGYASYEIITVMAIALLVKVIHAQIKLGQTND